VLSSLPSSNPWSTRTFLSIKPRSTALGQPVILTATVADLSRPQFNPTGTVAFMAGGTRLGTADLQAGKATLTMAALPAGRDRVRVVYLGTTDFRQSRSAILIERVGARAPDALLGDRSRNIAASVGTTSRVPLLRRQAIVNTGSGAEIVASSDL
jgi:Bacterial Ig-like domain (group 3)